MGIKISKDAAIDFVNDSKSEFETLFKHGSLELEIYKPEGTDKQTPHSRDEIYFIAKGQSKFLYEEEMYDVTEGDFLFVKAGKVHRFIDFTEDFYTWVVFYGPEGGEMGKIENSI